MAKLTGPAGAGATVCAKTASAKVARMGPIRWIFMRYIPSRHSILPAILLAPLLALALFALAAPLAPTSWLPTPPEPTRPPAAARAELAQRRAAVLSALAPNDVLVLFAAQPRVFSNDVDYPYRQENNFYYLAGINQEGGILLLSRAAHPATVLYMIKPDPAQESWTGHQLTPAESTALSGIADVRDVAGFGRVEDHLPAGSRLLLLDGGPREFPQETALRESLARTDPQLSVGDAN